MIQKFSDNLPWLIPLILTLMFGFAKLQSTIEKVDVMEELLRTKGSTLQEEVHDLQWEIKRIKENCECAG